MPSPRRLPASLLFGTAFLTVAGGCAVQPFFEASGGVSAGTDPAVAELADNVSVSAGDFAENRALVVAAAAQLEYADEVALSDLPLPADAATNIVDLDGTVWELRISALRNAAGSLDLSHGYGVAVDGDKFVPEGNLWSVRLYKANGDFDRVETVPLDGPIAPRDVPIFVLTQADITPPADDADSDDVVSSEEVPPAPPATSYLCLCGIDITTAKDSTTSDEFELYMESYASTTTSGVALPKYAGWNESSSSTDQFLFNGSSHKDAIGILKTFSDVNSTGNPYCATTSGGGVVIATLSSTCYWAMAPIEDDHTTGTFYTGSSAAARTNYYDCSTAGVSGPSVAFTSKLNQRYAGVYSVDPDDDYGGGWLGFNTSTSTSVTSQNFGSVTLYTYRSTSASCTSCTSWGTSYSCR